MRIMVTGGSGLIGQSVCDRLRDSHDVTALDLVESPLGDRTVVADITSYEQVKAAFKGQDAVVHLAGIPSLLPDHMGIMDANTRGTYTVLEAAATAGVRQIVYASSNCAYGMLFSKIPWMPEFLPLDETHPCTPDEPYGLGKLLGEQMCAAYTRRYQIDTTCLRFAMVLFPGSEKTRNFFSTINDPGGMAAQSSLNQTGEMTVTNAARLWAYVDVRDVAQSVQLSLEQGGGGHRVYNIGAADACSEIPSLDLVREYYPDLAELRHVNRLISRPFETLFSIERVVDDLGFAPRYSWRELAAEAGLKASND